MLGHHRWTVGLATGTGLLGFTVTGSLALAAHYFVSQFSHPHTILEEAAFTWKVPNPRPEPPASFQRPILFQTSDGTLLCGDFWAQPHPAPTVILCHGYRISRAHLRAGASVEYACGYNVFFFDFRGHGDSDSVATSGGSREVRDLEAALEVVRRQPETAPGKIIIHGFSMGASVALLMPPQPDVVGIIADSPYARSDDIIYRIIDYQLTQQCNGLVPFLRQLRYLVPAVTWAIIAVAAIDFRLRFHHGMVARPYLSFRKWKARAKRTLQEQTTPILLIHTVNDDLIPFAHAKQIEAEAKAYNVPLQTYFIEQGTHCAAFGVDPLGYNCALRDFLEPLLGDDFPEQHRQVEVNG